MTNDECLKTGLTEAELMKIGLEKLDDALMYFDVMESFEGKNLASLVYVALRYGEMVEPQELEAQDAA